MANWVADFLERNRDTEVVRRARHSIHVRSGEAVVAHFTGAPCHYLDEHGEWQPLDTTLRYDAARDEWGAPGLATRIRADGTVRGPGHTQVTRRVGVWNARTGRFTALWDLPTGRVDGDSLVREAGICRHVLTLTEWGLREELTILEAPPVAGGGDEWLALETAMPGLDAPDGLLPDFVAQGGVVFPTPWARDARGVDVAVQRRVRRVGGVPFLYTGLPVSALEGSAFPLTLDPDYTGSTADGFIYGNNDTYATARSTASYYYTNRDYNEIGQATGFWVNRSFLKFDTSSIPDGAQINQVNLKMACVVDNSATDFDVQIVKQNWSAQDPIATGNMEAAYDGCLAGTADDNIWRNTNGMAINTQYTSGNLSTSWPSKTGNTYYSLRSSRDFAGAQPTNNEYVRLASADHATASYRPVLSIVYSEGKVKKLAGITWASVKKVAGISEVSIKKVAGIEA